MSFDYACDTARFYLAPNVLYCADGNQWEDCTHPFNALTDAGTGLLNVLNSTIPNLYTANAVVNETSVIPYFEARKSATQSPRTATRTANVCLPHNACLVNTERQFTTPNSVPGNYAKPGSSVYVTAHSTDGGYGLHTVYPSGDGTQCLASIIQVKTPKKFLGSTKAWYAGSQVLHGRCAGNDDFFIIP